MERGEGLLGELTTDVRDRAGKVSSELLETLERCERIAEHDRDTARGRCRACSTTRALGRPAGVARSTASTRCSTQRRERQGAAAGAAQRRRSRRQRFDADARHARATVARTCERSPTELETQRRPAAAPALRRGVRRADRPRSCDGSSSSLRPRRREARPGRRHGRQADQRPADLRGGQRHHRRRQRVADAALADPQPAEEGDREALRGRAGGPAGGATTPLDTAPVPRADGAEL